MRDLEHKLDKLELEIHSNSNDLQEIYRILDSANLSVLERTNILIELGIIEPEDLVNLIVEGSNYERN